MPAASAPKEYRARIDSKKRLTLSGAENRDFRVLHRKDGSILLKPLVTDIPAPVSARTLRGMDKAVRNLRAGKRSKAANLGKRAFREVVTQAVLKKTANGEVCHRVGRSRNGGDLEGSDRKSGQWNARRRRIEAFQKTRKDGHFACGKSNPSRSFFA